MNMRLHPLLLLGLIAGLFFLHLPLVPMVLYSFSDSRLANLFVNPSWIWYRRLLEDGELMIATLNSLKVAFCSASLSTFLGLIGLAIWTDPFSKAEEKEAKRFIALSQWPLVMPEMILGLSLLILLMVFQKLFSFPKELGLHTITIAHTTVGIGYVCLLLRSRFSSMSPFLKEAALDLGAKPSTVFLKILLPLALPSLISSWLFVFIISFDDVILASFTKGPGAITLPLLLFARLRFGITPVVNALATLILIFMTVLLLCIMRYHRPFWKEKI